MNNWYVYTQCNGNKDLYFPKVFSRKRTKLSSYLSLIILLLLGIPSVMNALHFTKNNDLSTECNYSLDKTAIIDAAPSAVSVSSIPLPYYEDFESGQGGWAFMNVSGNSSWEFGTPAASTINSASSGTNAWATNLDGNYNNNENGNIQSPCFDFSNVCSPELSLDIWYDSQTNLDGVTIQYTTNVADFSSWQTVGSVGTGSNWYTHSSIPSINNTAGWSNSSGNYVKATHQLIGLAGQPQVWIRVFFGSDGNTTQNGVAFDNVSIVETSSFISSYPYNEDFEGGEGGWTHVNISGNSTWEWGIPSATTINSASSGTKAWATNLDGDYSNDESDYVQSPCFDFSDLCSPKLSLDIWYETQNSIDGARIETSIDGGVSWQVLGNSPLTGLGAHWYNESFVFALGSSDGWTGSSSGYVPATRSLDGLAGQSQVLIRIYFASDPISTSNGVAFDNVSVFDDTSFPYNEDFEQGQGNWSIVNISNSQWEFGKPNASTINAPHSGFIAMGTNLNGNHSDNAQGYIQSPCFDFSTFCMPEISLAIWYETENGRDGAIVQSSIDGGSTWQNIGAVGTGTNWYNTGSISGLPNSTSGWSGSSGGYVTATHSIDNLDGQAEVIFRVYFGSDFSITNNGVVIDDISILITDNSPPPNAMCQNHTTTLNNNGDATILVTDIDNGSTDNCEITSSTLSQFTFNCDDIGANSVTLFLQDAANNTSFCVATVTVQDSTNPTATCQDLTIELDNGGTASITPMDVDNNSTDNCMIMAASSTVVPNTFDCIDIGVQTTTLTVFDQSGNTHSCIANITIEDNIPPSVTCTSPTLSLDANGDFLASTSTFVMASTDNCVITSTLIQSVNATTKLFDCDDVGMLTETIIVEDQSGNTNTCIATITVEDIIAPTAVCTSTIVNLDVNGMGSITATDVDGGSDDACGIASLSVSPNTFDCTDVGINMVTLTVTDENANTSTCTVNIIVSDQIVPDIFCIDYSVDLIGNMATIEPADVFDDINSFDNCDISAVSSVIPNAFDCTDVGDNVVMLSVEDVNGRVGSCTATVTVNDVTPPTAVCTPTSVDLIEDLITIQPLDVYDPSSSDNCGFTGASAATPNAFNCDDVGNNTVTLTVIDVNGNTSTCSTTVTVNDVTPPTATCQDYAVDLDGNGSVSIAASDIDDDSDDACDIGSLSVSPNTFDCNDIGGNTVTLTVFDTNGNSSTCSAIVTISDNEAPSVTCMDASVDLAPTTVSITPATIHASSDDNCAVSAVSSTVPSSFDCSNIGPNTVTLTIEDEEGNTNTCTATVTVNDVTAPTAVCENSVTYSLNSNGTIAVDASDIAAATSTDNCTTTLSFTFMSSNTITANYDCNNIGGNPETVIVTDASGNSNTCTTTVMIEDTTAPTAVCKPSIPITLINNTSVVITTANVDNGSVDNCDNNLTLSLSDDTFDCTMVTSITTTTLTVTDDYGNTSNCVAVLDYDVQDDIAPTAICISNLSIALDGTGNATITSANIDGGSSDNCSNVILTLSQSSFDCSHIGDNMITMTVMDDYGNQSICNSAIEILDNTAPTISYCPPSTSIDCSETTAPTNTGGFAMGVDNCGPITGTFTDDSSDPSITGVCEVIERTWTITDGFATLNCLQTITVEDNQAPTVTFLSPMTSTIPVTITSECTPVSNQTPMVEDDCTTGIVPVLSAIVTSQESDPTDCAHYNYDINYFWTATDDCGNTGSNIETIEVRDTQAPTVTWMTELTLANDAGSCDVNVTQLDITNFVTDCADFSVLTITNDSPVGSGGASANGTYSGFGSPYSITWTIIDPCGNVSNHTVVLTINDGESPTAICTPGMSEVVLNSSGVGTLPVTTVDNGSNDNCGAVTLALSQTSFDCTDIGMQTVTLTVTDGSGNFNECSASVLVSEDSPPAITCPPSITIDCTSAVTNTAITGMPTVSSACGATNTTSFSDAEVMTPTFCKEVVRTWTADNGAGVATCLQTITVDDNIAPSIAAISPTISATCTHIPLPAQVIMADDCSGPVSVTTTTVSTQDANTMTCGHYQYQIDRTYTAIDDCGNAASVTQTIMVTNDIPSLAIPQTMTVNTDAGICTATVSITLTDFVTDCTPADALTVTNSLTGGSTISGNYAPGQYTVSVSVTDPCGATAAQDFTLIVVDAQTPIAHCIGSATVALDNSGNGSLTALQINNGSSDNCGIASTTISQTTFTTADVGIVNVTLTVTDVNGNSATCSTPVTVTGTAAIHGGGTITASAGSTVNVPITANLFEKLVGFQFAWQLNNSPNPIGSITGSISNINPMLNGFTPANVTFDFSTNTVTAAWVDQTPVDLPDGSVLFEIEVAISATATNGNQSTLTIGGNQPPTEILQDFGSGPVSAIPVKVDGSISIDNSSVPVSLSGNLVLPGTTNGVSLINVILSGGSTGSQTTDGTGTYDFAVTPGSAATVNPSKDINPANGVTIFDFMKVQGHITNNPNFTLQNDCEKIAADVNRDGTMNIFDLFEIQAVINGGNFSNADSWEFSVGDCSAGTSTAHLVTPSFQESISYDASQTMMSQTATWTAIKMGNVTNVGGGPDDPNPANLTGVDDRNGDTFYFMTDEIELESGNIYEIPVRAKDFDKITGFQNTFEFNTDVITFESLLIQDLPDGSENNFGLQAFNEGKITSSWIGSANDWNEDNVLFTFRFTANENVKLSEVLFVTSAITPKLASNEFSEVLDVEIEFNETTSTNPNEIMPTFQLLQNRPNPFDNQTVIGFVLPQQDAISLTITNVAGQVIKVIEGSYGAGYHEIKVDNLQTNGIYYYELKTPNHTATRKMIFIK